jgi:tetratricopeptide (TPR) repeat protein
MRRVLAALLRRHLLSVEHRSAEPVYQQHAIVQQFYYETPARRERQAMHARAAAYYEQEQAALPAVRHYGLAGEHARAAAIVADQPWRLVQQDHAGAVSEALAAIVLDGLDGALRAGVRSAQAEAAVLLGEYRSARSLLEQAIADGNAVKGPGVVRQARRHRLLAIACERTGAYEQAEAACRRGLALAETGSGPRSESARLYAQLAEILLRRSAFAEAAGACRAGLAALPPEPAMPAERSNLLQRLATIEGQRDSYLPALELFEQSLDLARQAGDPLLMGLVLHNMGHAYYTLGQLERAVLCYNESLRFKAEIGDVAGRLRTLGNLGLIHMARGDNPAARHAFAESCELSEQYGLIEQQALARSNLGTLAYEEGDLITARAQIDATAGLYSRLGDPGGQAFCYYMLGDINLAEGNTVAALDSGQRALELARQAGRRPIESCALRVLGEVMLAQGQLAEADIVLAAAWALAEPVGDPYDQALILAAQARLARAGADSGSARHHAERSLILARANGIAHVQAHMEQVLHELDTPDPT